MDSENFALYALEKKVRGIFFGLRFLLRSGLTCAHVHSGGVPRSGGSLLVGGGVGGVHGARAANTSSSTEITNLCRRRAGAFERTRRAPASRGFEPSRGVLERDCVEEQVAYVRCVNLGRGWGRGNEVSARCARGWCMYVRARSARAGRGGSARGTGCPRTAAGSQ